MRYKEILKVYSKNTTSPVKSGRIAQRDVS